MSTYHTSVLLREAIQGLSVKRGKRYIDATVGGGGHAVEIVKQGGLLLGIDRDKEAIDEASRELVRHGFAQKPYGWILAQGNFRDIEKFAKNHGFEDVWGILFDLGVSSHQLDTPQRGFSYRFEEAPLDLRLNQEEGEPAWVYIARVSEKELYEVLAKYGEEELARPIAHAIVRARSIKPIRTAYDLRMIIREVLHRQNDDEAVLSRVFQALRIYVNDELGSLRDGIEGAQKILSREGRLVVISFHSLEDRLVKNFMKSGSWRVITSKPMKAERDECMCNPRARSAKLRIAEKI
ncbi:16S rRNA (cytosine(1402)-N(4))-methyltransferase [Candidatus Gottesmanbacteria bacterium RBG_13_45_10]|uniref:Ribosomal RNA small subunit methyltransferase H n=1 Tax=Candidatus Gottesmanbacteria bacterium RBG_13_45_10 TaxID=1798370 RepID=A0A1F5ZFR8_9BACT|nr:MAG: 16S rRNA (cytosine(1402)-N(4))-methyltransferase [Candidatus Gottesmanbacteria bacterium RBG_13_45_10]